MISILVTSKTITLEDGSIYKGDYCQRNKKHGFGKLTWKDQSYYEGEFRFDKAWGFGILNHKEGDIYRGE